MSLGWSGGSIEGGGDNGNDGGGPGGRGTVLPVVELGFVFERDGGGVVGGAGIEPRLPIGRSALRTSIIGSSTEPR